MVDLDKLKDKKGGSSGGNKSKSSGSSGSSGGSTNSSGGSTKSPDKAPGAFSLDEDNIAEPQGEVANISKEWADEHGELAYEANGNESMKKYISRQINECQELNENMEEMAKKHMDDMDSFTLYFHTLILNYVSNRVGIVEVLMDDFGKSEQEAIQLAHKISEESGEYEMIQGIIGEVTRKTMN